MLFDLGGGIFRIHPTVTNSRITMEKIFNKPDPVCRLSQLFSLNQHVTNNRKSACEINLKIKNSNHHESREHAITMLFKILKNPVYFWFLEKFLSVWFSVNSSAAV